MFIERQGHRYRDKETGQTLDVWFPDSEGELIRGSLAQKYGLIVGDVIKTRIESLGEPASSAEEIYLRLHLLSQRIVKPNEIELSGIFDWLHNVAWTSAVPSCQAKSIHCAAWWPVTFIILRSLLSISSHA